MFVPRFKIKISIKSYELHWTILLPLSLIMSKNWTVLPKAKRIKLIRLNASILCLTFVRQRQHMKV